MTKGTLVYGLESVSARLGDLKKLVEEAAVDEQENLLFEPEPRPGVRFRKGGGIKPVCAKISRQDFSRLRKMAKDEGATLSFAVRKLIHRGLAEGGGK